MHIVTTNQDFYKWIGFQENNTDIRSYLPVKYLKNNQKNVIKFTEYSCAMGAQTRSEISVHDRDSTHHKIFTTTQKASTDTACAVSHTKGHRTWKYIIRRGWNTTSKSSRRGRTRTAVKDAIKEKRKKMQDDLPKVVWKRFTSTGELEHEMEADNV